MTHDIVKSIAYPALEHATQAHRNKTAARVMSGIYPQFYPRPGPATAFCFVAGSSWPQTRVFHCARAMSRPGRDYSPWHASSRTCYPAKGSPCLS